MKPARRITGFAITLGSLSAWAAGCSSAPTKNPPPLALEGDFVAQEAGTIKELIFQEPNHYVLYPSTCSGGQADCPQEGPYQLNAAQTELSLQDDATGKVTVYPFEVPPPPPASTTLSTRGSLHIEGVTDPQPSGDTPPTSNSLINPYGSQSLIQVGLFRAAETWLLKRLKPPLGPDPDAKGPDGQRKPATKYPIVFVSGIMTSPTVNDFPGSQVALENDGHVVFTTNLNPFDGTEVRGEALTAQLKYILKTYPMVNIIAHSSGGTDARYAISTGVGAAKGKGGGLGPFVASLTTISTAHHGTPVASQMLEWADKYPNVAAKVQEIAPDLASLIKSDMTNSDVRAMFESITPENAQIFSDNYPNDPNVTYQSWAGVATILGTPGPSNDGAVDCDNTWWGGVKQSGVVHVGLQQAFFKIIDSALPGAANDSMVPTASAHWGTFRGCIPGDHLSEISAPLLSTEDPSTGYDPIRFFRDLAFELAAKGF